MIDWGKWRGKKCGNTVSKSIAANNISPVTWRGIISVPKDACGCCWVFITFLPFLSHFSYIYFTVLYLSPWGFIKINLKLINFIFIIILCIVNRRLKSGSFFAFIYWKTNIFCSYSMTRRDEASMLWHCCTFVSPFFFDTHKQTFCLHFLGGWIANVPQVWSILLRLTGSCSMDHICTFDSPPPGWAGRARSVHPPLCRAKLRTYINIHCTTCPPLISAWSHCSTVGWPFQKQYEKPLCEME